MGGVSAAVRRQVRRIGQMRRLLLTAWGHFEPQQPRTRQEWRNILGEEFIKVCSRTLATNSTLKGRERIQCAIVLQMLEGVAGDNADGVGSNPKAPEAKPPN